MPTKPTAHKRKPRHGKPPIRSLEDVFSPIYCDKSAPGGCWLWLGSKGHKGYPVFIRGTRRIRVHRFILEHMGKLPDPGLFVLHKCDVPPCINPEHLFPGTPADNMADMWAKGRGRHGIGASGVRGVRWVGRTKRWSVMRGEKYIKSFKKLDDAIAYNQTLGEYKHAQ